MLLISSQMKSNTENGGDVCVMLEDVFLENEKILVAQFYKSLRNKKKCTLLDNMILTTK